MFHADKDWEIETQQTAHNEILWLVRQTTVHKLKLNFDSRQLYIVAHVAPERAEELTTWFGVISTWTVRLNNWGN